MDLFPKDIHADIAPRGVTSTVQKWGRVSFEDDSCFGDECSATATTNKNIYLIPHTMMNDRWFTKKQITSVISTFWENVENTLHNEYGMTKDHVRGYQIFWHII